MVKYFRKILVLFLLCVISIVARAQDTPFDQLRNKFKEGMVFHAKFKHQTLDSYTQDTVSRKGFIWIAEDRYKIRTSNQSVVVNGKTSIVYDNSRNRVIISKYEPSEDDFAPSRILNGIDSTYTIQAQKQRDDEIYIRLASDDAFAIFKKVEIYLSKALIPMKIKAVDSADNIITTSFYEGSFTKPKQNMFQPDYPSGAKVVDMRE